MNLQSMQRALSYIPSQMWAGFKGLTSTQRKTALIATAIIGLLLAEEMKYGIIQKLVKWAWKKLSSHSASLAPPNGPQQTAAEKVNGKEFRDTYIVMDQNTVDTAFEEGTFDEDLAKGLLEIVELCPEIQFYILTIGSSRSDNLSGFEPHQRKNVSKKMCLVQATSRISTTPLPDPNSKFEDIGYFKLTLYCNKYEKPIFAMRKSSDYDNTSGYKALLEDVMAHGKD